ncbi:MAG: Uma2 family endonuclease [Acidobacteriota bacterium]
MKQQEPYRMKAASPAIAAPSSTSRVSYQDFLAQSELTRAEWVDGRVIELTSPPDRHQDLASFLTALLRVFAEARQLGVVRPTFQMKTGPSLPGRQPDILFVGARNTSRIRKNHLEGAADLAIEIVSPESRSRDHEEKFNEYEQGGVGEYWLIEAARREAQFYRLGEDGQYHLAALQEGTVFRSSALPGLWLNVEWLWQNPLPPVLSVLKEWQLL